MKNKKSQDPTEAALSAIEDALNIGNEAPAVAPPASIERSERRDQRVPETAGEVFAQRSRGTRERLPRPAANDDRQSVGQILQALHQRPSSASMLVALLGSVIWIIGGAAVASTQFRTATGAVMRISEIAATPSFMPTLAAIFLPPLLFFMTAMLIRRSQEMRHISRAMTEVTLRLAEPEGISTDAIVSVGQAIRREVAALGDGIERAVARASELESMVRSEVATLERAYDENENRVRGLIGDLHGERDAIVEHSAHLREAIASAHEAFAFDVQNIADRVASALDNATGRITDNIVMRAEEARSQIIDSGNSIVESLTERSEEANRRLLDSGRSVVDSLVDKSDEATRRLLESGRTVVDSLADKSAEATQRLTEVGVQIAKAIADRNEKVSEELAQSTAEMHAKLAERAAGISQLIAESGQTFENSIGQQLQNLADSIALKGNELANRISADSGALSQTMAESVQTFDTTVKVYGVNIANEMKTAISNLAEASHESLSVLDERVTNKINEVSGQVEERLAQVERTLDERAKSLNETLTNHTIEFTKTISDGSQAAAEAVDRSVTGMGEYFAARTAEMAATLSERAARIDETLGNRAMQLTETLDTRVNKFEELIVNRLESVTSTIEQKGVASADLLVERVNAVNDHLRGTAEQIEVRLGDTSNQIERRLGETSEQVAKRLTDTTDHVARRLGDSSEQAAKRIGETSEQIERRIGDTSMQVHKNLTDLSDGITKNFIERVNNITGAHETLRAEVRDIIAELGQTHGLLQAAIDTASSTLGPIEGKIAEKVQNFHQTLENAMVATKSVSERMDSQIRLLTDSSNGVLRDVSSLALRFEEQVRQLATTTDSLNITHQRIDDGLAARRDAIDQITNALSERTVELEERLGRFNKMLAETFDHAQGKAQEVARLVAESTAASTQAISRQYELIRSASTEERERTTVALKDTYDEALQSVNAMFADANTRFLEASRDLREISEEIQRTLDTTREEIRRTVFELPVETKESANAMRRVVADQIKALSELNDIVARHGRHEAPVAYAYQEEMAAVGGRSAPRGALPRPPYDAGDHDMPPPPPVRLREPAPEPRRPERKPVDRTARFDEALNKQPQPIPAEPEMEDSSTGIESLDSLSVDIARMIDHEAAAEAWERFKRGERGVFNRRLYTTAGQKSFEEIRKKYRRNANFRETVDRYIDEFEKLLEQVSRDDRGQALTRTYLTSDTGKVYTLLAHAAGRLG